MFRALLCLLISLSAVYCVEAQDAKPSDASQGKEQVSDSRQVLKVDNRFFTTRSNPKTLALPAGTEAFQIAIYGDRTGGEPSGLKYLRQAVKDTNLIDPDFTMTVGDLIQGYNQPEEWMPEMKEFKEIMNGLEREWFPVAGNHDIYWDFRDPDRPREHHEGNYEKSFGPLWYSFHHKEHGFIVLYSDEGDLETGEKGFRQGRMQNMSDEQLEFLEKSLEQLGKCKKVFCFLHHPRWLGGGYEGSNWPEVHKRLVAAGNVGAVFAGHIHHMTYVGPVDGIEYYSLGTTGGHLAMESPELGYLHHFNLLTVRPDGFSVAAVPVGAVIDPKTFDKAMLDDVNLVRGTRPKLAGEKLLVNMDASVSQEYSLALKNRGIYPVEATFSPVVPAGWQAVPDHQHVTIGPGKVGEARFYFVHKEDATSPTVSFGVPKIRYAYEYLHPKSRIRLPESSIAVEMGLAELPPDAFAKDMKRCLSLRGTTSPRTRRQREVITTDSAMIRSNDLDLPQGPFTLEAWVRPTDIRGSRAVIAKTQSSEFAIFLHEGIAQFDAHVGGDYRSPKSKQKIEINQWTHIAGVFDGKECRLYVDGKKLQTVEASGSRKTNKLPLYIGADPEGSGNPSREFAGQLDEIRISTGVRYTDNFIPARRHKTDSTTKLLLHFDQQVGPFVIDDSKHQTSVVLLGKANVDAALETTN